MLKKQNLVTLTRRQLLGAMASVGAASVMTGCSKGDEEENYVPAPPVKETIHYGNSANNCGGSCLIQAHVANGRITRFTTDERPDSPDDYQLRGCCKCRSFKGRLYHPARLRYPMIQRGERGDLSSFEVVSWDEALNYFCKKYKHVLDTYGGESVLTVGGSGPFHTIVSFSFARVWNYGGKLNQLGTYSSHQVSFAGNMIHKSRDAFTMSPETWLDADTILLWGANFAESINGTNNPYYQVLAKKKGTYSYFIGPMHNTTCEIANEWVPIKQGTDGAMMLAMLYVMIDENLIDHTSIDNYTVGFYDDPTGTSKSEIVANTADYLKVPAGKSLSAYIMGTDDRLVVSGKNMDTSRYPHNTSSKFAYKHYGRTPKTPEWAEQITGVPADKIREITRRYCSGKSILNASLGLQRQMEGVTNMWLLAALTMASGQWGRQGTGYICKYGRYGDPIATKQLYETTLGANSVTKNVECNLWPDAARAKHKNIPSEYGDGWVNALTKPIKFVANVGANFVDTHMDSFRNIELMKDKSNIECIFTVDHFMTNTARYSDIIFPGDMPWERYDITYDQAVWSFVAGNHLIFLDKVVEPLGEAKNHYWMAEQIAERLGWKDADGNNLATKGKTDLEWIEWIYEGTAKSGEVPFEQFRKQGIVSNPYTKHFVGSKALRDAGACSDKLNFYSYNASSGQGTRTGYVELFSNRMVEAYETRGAGQNNTDSEGDKYVYEIPVYFEPMDGYIDNIFASNPNVDHEYPLLLTSNHHMFRSHSTHNNNPYLREIVKKDGTGAPVYDATTYAADMFQGNYATEEGFERIFINPEDAAGMNIYHGQKVKVTSAMTGKSILACAWVSPRIVSGSSLVYHGSWTDIKDGIDQGGCSNVLFNEVPSRMDHGPVQMTAFIKIEAL